MAQQKLYTEEQVLGFLNFYESANPREYGGYQHPTMDGSERLHNNQTTKNILNAYTNSITPIELPSDEEINEFSPYVPQDASIDFWANKEGFIEGAKWLRDKIQGGNK